MDQKKLVIIGSVVAGLCIFISFVILIITLVLPKGPAPSPKDPCPAGFYNPIDGTQPCMACPMGTTTYYQTGAKSCTSVTCQENTYSPTGKGPCTQCPPRTTTNYKVGATSCEAPNVEGIGSGEPCSPSDVCASGYPCFQDFCP